MMPYFVGACEGLATGGAQGRDDDYLLPGCAVHTFHRRDIEEPNFNPEASSQVVNAERLPERALRVLAHLQRLYRRDLRQLLQPETHSLAPGCRSMRMRFMRRSRSFSLSLLNCLAASRIRSSAPSDSDVPSPVIQAELTP